MSRTLDPALLDPIVAELELADLAAMERLMLTVRLILNDIEAWLRRLAKDENSWFNRLADLIGATDGSAPSWGLLDVLIVVVPTLIGVAALGLVAAYLWRIGRTRHQPASIFPQFPGPAPSPVGTPIASLPAREQPAALFQRACSDLADEGMLHFEKFQTNSAIARAALLTGSARDALTRLAMAADRAIFGGWQPDDADLRELRRDCQELLGEQRLQT